MKMNENGPIFRGNTSEPRTTGPVIRTERHANAMPIGRSESTRFTRDGSESLERRLAAVCARIADEVRKLIPAGQLDGLVLAGGYGRGEGGVLREATGDQPYNDLEFYVFVRGNALLGERRYRTALQQLGERLTPVAGVDVEFKVVTVEKLRAAPTSMFSYDLMMGHRWLVGDDSLLAGCVHHRAAAKISLAEASRLLMNRCTGLLFSAERLRRERFGPEEADFVARNLAKLQLALGDVLLAAQGDYHWSCCERQLRVAAWRGREGFPAIARVQRHHVEGVRFKLHPYRSGESREALLRRHAELSQLARELFLWLENRRLGSDFATTRAYAVGDFNLCPETAAWRNRLVNVRAFGLLAGVGHSAIRYPRERLLRALPVLLWEETLFADAALLQSTRSLLRTTATDFSGLVAAYEQLWHRFN